MECNLSSGESIQQGIVAGKASRISLSEVA